MKKEFNLQLFAEDETPTSTAETNLTVAADLEPAISIDFTTRLAEGLETLRRIVSVNEGIPMNVGQFIKQYKTSIKNKPTAQAGEGEVIPLTEVERKLVNTIEVTFKKYRKATSMEAIQKIGQDKAINQTDATVLKMIQKEIKKVFFDSLTKGTGSATAKAHGLQAALAAAWGALQEKFDDYEATPIYFINSGDVADYLATANITLQTAFGFTYVENFLGLGDAFITPQVPAGTIKATAKENLNMAYIPSSSSEIAQVFSLTSDETGLVGMTHTRNTTNATVETLLISGVIFFAEELDKVIGVAITEPEEEPDEPIQGGN